MTVFGFLDIGSGELLLILVIALIVFGPQKLPEIASKIGKTTREFKKYAADVQRQINEELEQAKGEPGSSPTVESKPMPLEAMIKPSNPANPSSPVPQSTQSSEAHPALEVPQSSESHPVLQKSDDIDDPK